MASLQVTRQTFDPPASCCTCQGEALVTCTGRCHPGFWSPTQRPHDLCNYLFLKMKKEKESSLGSICSSVFLHPTKICSFSSSLFSIWSNDSHAQIISSLRQRCHQEAIKNTSLVSFPPPIPSLNVRGQTDSDARKLQTLGPAFLGLGCSAGHAPALLLACPPAHGYLELSCLPPLCLRQPSHG